MESLRETAKKAYSDASALLLRPEMKKVVTGGLTILCGPPIERPDLFLLSFQGGGAIPDIHATWPERLVYLKYGERPEPAHKFSRNLCNFSREAGIFEKLESSCVAVPAVFPGEKHASANAWTAEVGPRAEWRKFSVNWVRKLVLAAKPKVIVVFGQKASQSLGLNETWTNVERNHGQGFMTFGETQYCGFPVVYSGHLSQGYVGAEVVRSLRRAGEIIGFAND